MKRILQLLLAAIVLLAFSIPAWSLNRMVIPDRSVNWSVGSNVQLEWQLRSDIPVTVRLIQGDNNWLIAENLPVRTGILDPLGGSDFARIGGYQALLTGLADSYADCLGQ